MRFSDVLSWKSDKRVDAQEKQVQENENGLDRSIKTSLRGSNEDLYLEKYPEFLSNYRKLFAGTLTETVTSEFNGEGNNEQQLAGPGTLSRMEMFYNEMRLKISDEGRQERAEHVMDQLGSQIIKADTDALEQAYVEHLISFAQENNVEQLSAEQKLTILQNINRRGHDSVMEELLVKHNGFRNWQDALERLGLEDGFDIADGDTGKVKFSLARRKGETWYQHPSKWVRDLMKDTAFASGSAITVATILALAGGSIVMPAILGGLVGSVAAKNIARYLSRYRKIHGKNNLGGQAMEEMAKDCVEIETLAKMLVKQGEDENQPPKMDPETNAKYAEDIDLTLNKIVHVIFQKENAKVKEVHQVERKAAWTEAISAIAGGMGGSALGSWLNFAVTAKQQALETSARLKTEGATMVGDKIQHFGTDSVQSNLVQSSHDQVQNIGHYVRWDDATQSYHTVLEKGDILASQLNNLDGKVEVGSIMEKLIQSAARGDSNAIREMVARGDGVWERFVSVVSEYVPAGTKLNEAMINSILNGDLSQFGLLMHAPAHSVDISGYVFTKALEAGQLNFGLWGATTALCEAYNGIQQSRAKGQLHGETHRVAASLLIENTDNEPMDKKESKEDKDAGKEKELPNVTSPTDESQSAVATSEPTSQEQRHPDNANPDIQTNENTLGLENAQEDIVSHEMVFNHRDFANADPQTLPKPEDAQNNITHKVDGLQEENERAPYITAMNKAKGLYDKIIDQSTEGIPDNGIGKLQYVIELDLFQLKNEQFRETLKKYHNADNVVFIVNHSGGEPFSQTEAMINDNDNEYHLPNGKYCLVGSYPGDDYDTNRSVRDLLSITLAQRPQANIEYWRL